MDVMLSTLDKQDNCTPASGLAMILAILRISLHKCYPNILKKPIEKEYDFIVVGGGTAGCIVASRLTEDPNIKVLVVEAGGEEPPVCKVPGIAENEALGNSSIDWHFWTEPHPEYCGGRPCYLPRAKMMGGCDSHNEMWYLIPNRKLHDDLTKRGIEGWSYEEMLPYYKRRSEALLKKEDGAEGDASIERFPYTDENFNVLQQAYREMGYSQPSSNGDFEQDYKTTSKGGERVSSNALFMETVRKRPNLQVTTETQCTKLIVDPKTKSVSGVELMMLDEKKEKIVVKAKKEVIVSCGVINTPQLLQLSGIGPKVLLEALDIKVIKDLPVGNNFQNHPSFSGPILNLTSTSTVPRDCDSMRKDIRRYITEKAGPFAGSGAYISYLICNSTYASKEVPDLMLAMVPSIAGMDLPDAGFSMCYYNRLSMRMMTTRVASPGTIAIKSKDPLMHPTIRLGYEEKQAPPLGRGFELAYKIAKSETFKKFGYKLNKIVDPRCKDKEYGSYEYWLCAIKGRMQFWHHGMSSCSMGPKDDPVAVVDNKCKVYGIKGLRIIDASIIPLVPNVNPNALVLATAERCVDFLKRDYY